MNLENIEMFETAVMEKWVAWVTLLTLVGFVLPSLWDQCCFQRSIAVAPKLNRE